MNTTPPTPALPPTPQEIHRLKAVLEYLERIPEEQWGRGRFKVPHKHVYCAIGQLQRPESPLNSGAEPLSVELTRAWDFSNWLFDHYQVSLLVENDNSTGTPKQAVLKALRGVLRRIEQEPAQ